MCHKNNGCHKDNQPCRRWTKPTNLYITLVCLEVRSVNSTPIYKGRGIDKIELETITHVVVILRAIRVVPLNLLLSSYCSLLTIVGHSVSHH